MKEIITNLSSYLPLLFRPSTLAMTDYSSNTYHNNNQINMSQGQSFSFKKFKRFIRNSRYLPFIVVIVIVVVIGAVVINSAINRPSQTPTNTMGASASNSQVTPVEVAKPLATETLNRTFNFPLNDSTGKEVSKFQYEIQSAELDNQIVVQGQVATAVQGRAFLVLNLKITNNYDKSVQLNTRDYVRLIVDNDGNRLAADIHNDPVDVEAISTKYTRLGFPIDSNYKSLKLEVGEITGPKQTIILNLK